jgi:hypothetical protein
MCVFFIIARPKTSCQFLWILQLPTYHQSKKSVFFLTKKKKKKNEICLFLKKKKRKRKSVFFSWMASQFSKLVLFFILLAGIEGKSLREYSIGLRNCIGYDQGILIRNGAFQPLVFTYL